MVDKNDLKNKAKALAKKVEGKTSELKSQAKQVAKKAVKSAKNVAKDISANYPTKVTAKEAKDKIVRELGEIKPQATKAVARSIPVAKQVAEYLPFASSLYDIGRGGYQAFHGHPYLGTAQAGLGGLGLVADLYTGGKGSTIAKGALKPVVEGLGKRLAPTMSKWSTRVGVPTVMEFLYRDKKDTTPTEQTKLENMQDVSTEQPSRTQYDNYWWLTNNKPQGNYNSPYTPARNNRDIVGPSDSITDIINRNTGNQSYSNYQEPKVEQDDTTTSMVSQPMVMPVANVDNKPDYSEALLNAITRRQNEYAQPYLKSLDTYGRQLPWAKMADYFSKIATAGYGRALDNSYLGNMGSIGAEDLASIYPQIAKTKADTLGELLNSQVGRYANAQAASDAGITPLAGLSDKTMLQQLGALKRAETSAEARRYVANQYLKGREDAIQAQRDIAQLRANIQLKLQDRALSSKERMQLRQLDNTLRVQQMRSQSMYDVAQLGAFSRPYSMGFGITPEYGRAIGYRVPSNITPPSGMDQETLQQILGK